MKFVKVDPVVDYYCETEDGTYYRCNYNGTIWERFYGESWEPVSMYNKEAKLREAFAKYRGGYSEGPVSDGGMDPRT